MKLTEEVESQYNDLFRTCQIQENHRSTVESDLGRILKSRARYEGLGAQTGVPWYVIATIHCLECGSDFTCHLHNGDPLSGKTRNWPPGRPPGQPPFSWETSAMDALDYDGLTSWRNWSLAGTLYKLEAFNGWGYRNYDINTPYLWSFSNHYTKGKYTSDGHFDSDALSGQCGAAVILKALQEEGLIELGRTPIPAPLGSPPPYPGRSLKHGDEDSQSVRPLQQRLNDLGCGPIDVDGDFGSQTEAAVRLFQARSVDSRGMPLVVDGIVGALTWQALFGAATMNISEAGSLQSPLLQKAIECARAQIGVMEDPPGSNRGPQVEEYQRAVGVNPGDPWCAAFVYWCFEQSASELGIRNPLIRTGGVLDHWDQARSESIRRVTCQQAMEDPSLVLSGFIFIIDTGAPGGAGHTGLVERVEGGLLTTIEGNTNEGGGREGVGVFRRNTRKILSINKGFIDYRKA